MRGRLGSVATSAALIVSIATPAFAEPSAAFPPEPPAPGAARAPQQPHAAPPQQAPASVQAPAVYARPRPLYYPPPAPSLRLIEVRSDVPGTYFAVEVEPGRGALQWCRDSCWIHLSPGRYRVEVAASPGTPGGKSRRFRIEGPAMVEVSPRSQAAHDTWLGLAIGSTVLLAVGLVATLAYGVGQNSGDSAPRPTPAWMYGAMFAGLVATPFCWVMFGFTFRPGVTVERLAR